MFVFGLDELGFDLSWSTDGTILHVNSIEIDSFDFFPVFSLFSTQIWNYSVEFVFDYQSSISETGDYFCLRNHFFL